jgi:hypothetical protein
MYFPRPCLSLASLLRLNNVKLLSGVILNLLLQRRSEDLVGLCARLLVREFQTAEIGRNGIFVFIPYFILVHNEEYSICYFRVSLLFLSCIFSEFFVSVLISVLHFFLLLNLLLSLCFSFLFISLLLHFSFFYSHLCSLISFSFVH